MDGFSQEHDSLVPYVSEWCIEDDFETHYYTNQADTGNQILDAAGFTIDPGTGYRLAPDGSPFDVVIEYGAGSPEIAGGTAQIGVDALRALDVNAETRAASFNEYISRCGGSGVYTSRCGGAPSFDMVFYCNEFVNTDVQWLAYEYWSEYADMANPYENYANFRNDTYDSWRDQLLFGTTYEEIYEAAAEMQKILQYNVPRLVVYDNTYMQMYRSDSFAGHVGDLVQYLAGPWTMRNIHQIDGGHDKPVTIALTAPVDSFNLYIAERKSASYIFDNIYSSLYQKDPNQMPIGDLATNILSETHDDNPSVPVGHTRFTVDIIENATWSDGTPLTAEDVAFTFTYILESGPDGNPMYFYLDDLQSAIWLGQNKVRFEFNTESYWHFNTFAFVKIIPKHIFNDVDGIGYEGWNTWNPVFDSEDPLVTSGPFIFTNMGVDDNNHQYYELTQNPRYHWNPNYSDTFIRPQEDITYIVGSQGNQITWETILNKNATYTLYRDSEMIEDGVWESGNLLSDIDGLAIGSYEYTIEVTYDGGYSESSSVIVIVLDELPPPPGQPVTPLQALAIVVSAGAITVILWVACVSKRTIRTEN
jgi:ABC-type transport system substrate-binding protein